MTVTVLDLQPDECHTKSCQRGAVVQLHWPSPTGCNWLPFCIRCAERAQVVLLSCGWSTADVRPIATAASLTAFVEQAREMAQEMGLSLRDCGVKN